MLNSFSWNGVEIDSFETVDTRLIVRKCPSLSRPMRKYDRYSVPGRNGDIIVLQNAYENYTQDYEVFLYTDSQGVKLNALCGSVAQWLYSASGYAELIDDHEPAAFRLAYFVGPFNVENLLTEFGRATISFNCRPERYLISGNEVVTPTLESGWATITNPTGMTAKPQIRITLGNYNRIKIEQLHDDVTNAWIYEKQTGATELVVDSESYSWQTEVAFAGRNVTGTDFPLLHTGNTYIKVSEVNSSGADTGNYPSWSYVPRWWTL